MFWLTAAAVYLGMLGFLWGWLEWGPVFTPPNWMTKDLSRSNRED